MSVRRRGVVPPIGGRIYTPGTDYQTWDGGGRTAPAKSESGLLEEALQKLALASDNFRSGREHLVMHGIKDAQSILSALLRQVRSRVHANPVLAVVGNPGGVCLSRGGVQAIVYQHERRDIGNRAHGFGDATLTLKDTRNGLLIGGLEDRTGVSMYGSADKKTITVRGDRGQRLWDYFGEEYK